jgi:hypothetical protein
MNPLEVLRDSHTPIWRVEEVLIQHPELLEPTFGKDRFGNPVPDSPAYSLLERRDLSVGCLQAIANICYAILPLGLTSHPNITPDILEQIMVKNLLTLEQRRNGTIEDNKLLETRQNFLEQNQGVVFDEITPIDMLPNLLDLLQLERFWQVGYRQIGLWELQIIHTMLTELCIHPKFSPSAQTLLLNELCKTVLSPYQLTEISKTQHELFPVLIAASLEVYLAQLETTTHPAWVLRDLSDFSELAALQPTDQGRLLEVLLRYPLTLRHKISLSFSPHPSLKALAEGIDGTEYRVF